jgi:hypothetical protein
MFMDYVHRSMDRFSSLHCDASQMRTSILFFPPQIHEMAEIVKWLFKMIPAVRPKLHWPAGASMQ